MEGEKVKTKKTGGIDYYRFSRCRYWNVSIIPQLAFNAPISKPPQKNSQQGRYFKAIRDGIDSGQLQPHPRGTITRWSRGGNSFCALNKWMLDDLEFYQTRLLAGEVFRWAICQEAHGFKLAPEFLEMGEEICAVDFSSQITVLRAWSLPNIIRMVLGERFKDWPECPEEMKVKNFVELLEAEVSSGNLNPLQSLSVEKIKELKFAPIDLIRFVVSERFIYWRISNRVDILEWVSRMFEEIEAAHREKEFQQNQEAKNPTEIKNQDSQSAPKKKRDDKFSRADPEGKIQAAVKKAKAKKIRQNLVPYCEEIHMAIKGIEGSFSMSDDYEKQSGHKLTTIERIVRKGYKE